MKNMHRLTDREKSILINLVNKEAKDVATALGMSLSTLEAHLSQIRAKRIEAKSFLKETDKYSKILYPKRKGE
jgi:FixJ family two-component response regulator